jgi:TolB-like protein/Flp pilus assembly protein TadD
VNPSLDPDLIRHALARVRASRELRRSPGLQGLLTFLMDAALTGRADEIKESVIGVEVFHRVPGYDAKADPIVRVQANRLRRKLARYYATEGAQDLVGISLPNGAYVPAFERRTFEPGTEAGSGPARPARLLVLPFANLTGREDREFFSDGLAEELIHRLSSLPGLQVLARTTAFALKRAALDVKRLRERFAVDVLIEGGVQQTAERVRVNLRFIGTQDGDCIWSGAFERPHQHALRLHDDVAGAVTRQLKLQVVGSAPGSGRVLPPTVHEAFLLGRYFLHRWRPEQTPDPAGYFRRAIEADPTFAPAYCGLADCLYLRAHWAQASPAEIMPQAVAAVERALRLDASLADAHCSLGILRNAFDWDSEACRRSLVRCLELDRGHATGRCEYAASYLTPLGRLEEARGWLMEARELDPLSPLILFHLAQNAWYAGHHELAVANAASAVELDRQFTPAHWILALAAAHLGRWDQAEAALTQARATSVPIYSGAVEVWVRAAQGRLTDARQVMRELLALRTREYCSDACLAFGLLALGERQQALQLIVEAIKARDPHLRLMGVAPVWRGLAEDPAWPQLLQLVRLPGTRRTKAGTARAQR